jgi:FixJ family two-component response regulator
MPAAIEPIKSALERDAERPATDELQRRHARLASLRPTEREVVTVIAHRVAQAVAVLLFAEAQIERRLAAAPSSMYLAEAAKDVARTRGRVGADRPAASASARASTATP